MGLTRTFPGSYIPCRRSGNGKVNVGTRTNPGKTAFKTVGWRRRRCCQKNIGQRSRSTVSSWTPRERSTLRRSARVAFAQVLSRRIHVIHRIAGIVPHVSRAGAALLRESSLPLYSSKTGPCGWVLPTKIALSGLFRRRPTTRRHQALLK